MAIESQSGLHEIGNIIKAQGTLGGFILEAVHPAIQLNDMPDIVYIRYPEHQWCPYRVEIVRHHHDRKRTLFFVKLKGINSRTEAEKLRDHQMMTDRHVELPASERNILGYSVMRTDTTKLGFITDLLDTPAYTLIVVTSTSGESRTLIPWIDEFVSEVDHESSLIITKNTSDLESLN